MSKRYFSLPPQRVFRKGLGRKAPPLKGPKIEEAKQATPETRSTFSSLLSVLNVLSVAIAAAALWFAMDANRLTRAALDVASEQTRLAVLANELTVEALDETRRQSDLTVSALNETVKQTGLTEKALELTNAQMQLSQQQFEQSQVVSAWQILSARAVGNTGKTEALEMLNDAGKPFDWIDLSCQTMAGATLESECDIGVWLRSADLRGGSFTGANLAGAFLHGADLREAYLHTGNFTATFFGAANLEKADLSNADLSAAAFGHAKLANANLAGAELQDAAFHDANISGTVFCDLGGCVTGASYLQFVDAWAWADNPPIFSYKEKYQIDARMPRLCDPSLREAYETALEESNFFSYSSPDSC